MEGQAHQKVKDQSTQNKKPRLSTTKHKKFVDMQVKMWLSATAKNSKGMKTYNGKPQPAELKTAELEILFNFSNQL